MMDVSEMYAATQSPNMRATQTKAVYDTQKGMHRTETPLNKMAMLVTNKELTQEKSENQPTRTLPEKI